MIFPSLGRHWKGLASIHSALSSQGFTAYRRYEELVLEHCATRFDACDVSLATYFDERGKEYLCSGGKISESRRATFDWNRLGEAAFRSTVIDRLVLEQRLAATQGEGAPQRVRAPHPCLDSFYARRASDPKYALSVSEQVRISISEESRKVVALTDPESELNSSKILVRAAFENSAASQGFVKDRKTYVIDACKGLSISVSADIKSGSSPLAVSLNVALIDRSDDDMPHPILLSAIIPGYGYYESGDDSSLDLKHRLFAQMAGVSAVAASLR